MQSRPLRDFERGAHLHVLDWAHQTARHRFEAAGAVQVKAAAQAIAANPTAVLPDLPSLEEAVHQELRKLYALGHLTVRSELAHQLAGHKLPVGLSAPGAEALQLAADGDQPAHASLRARARLAAADIAHTIHQAIQRAVLQGITQPRRLRALGQAAGHQALRSAASHHAGGAIAQGRHAAATIHTAEGEVQVIGARYTSILDKNTCGPCASADDGVLRALDDPALVHPPNPDCLGGDRCRCLLIYQLKTEGLPVTPTPVAVGAAG